MITEKLMNEARSYALNEVKTYCNPTVQNIDLSMETGKRLAKQLGADEGIVVVGTLLMDCQLGKAIADDRIGEHIDMGVVEARKILERDSEITAAEIENIIHCIKEHHGAQRFFSIESEICCNADCYRFASVEGFIKFIRYAREMPLKSLIELSKYKADEKWNALSLEICKQELSGEYLAIKEMIRMLEATSCF